MSSVLRHNNSHITMMKLHLCSTATSHVAQASSHMQFTRVHIVAYNAVFSLDYVIMLVNDIRKSLSRYSMG
jgi:hypothetical protein